MARTATERTGELDLRDPEGRDHPPRGAPPEPSAPPPFSRTTADRFVVDWAPPGGAGCILKT